MKLFGQRHSEEWHRQVYLTSAVHHPIGPDYIPNQVFPWTQLQRHTDTYLSKKKGNLTPEQRDARLVLLVQKHGAKDIAVAAVGHVMSGTKLRELLVYDLNITPGDSNTLPSYLQTVIAANYVNSTSVSALEAQRAMELLASSSLSGGDYLEALIRIILNGVPEHFLIHRHVHELAKNACGEFSSQLDSLRNSCQWLRAHASTEWLTRFFLQSVAMTGEDRGRGEYQEATKLLDSFFPHWRAWASWRPDLGRISKWNRFANLALLDLFALEGPDFLNNSYPTSRQAQEAQVYDLSRRISGLGPSLNIVWVGKISFELERKMQDELQVMLDRLMKIVDIAVMSGPNETNLLAHFCVDRAITHGSLECLDCVISLRDASISSTLCQVFQVRKETRSTQMAAVMRLLPVMGSDRCQKLRETVGPDVANLVNTTLEEMQTSLGEELKANQLDVGDKLQTFGKALENNPWLWTWMDNSFLDLLKEWPSKEQLAQLRSIRLAAQAALNVAPGLSNKVDSYFLNLLVQQGTIAPSTSMLINALINLWQRTSNPAHRSVALAVAGAATDIGFQCRFLSQIPELPQDFVQALQNIIIKFSENANEACVDLVRLLISADLPEVLECWRPFLCRMMQKQGDTLVDYCLGRLSAEEWFKLLRDIRSIFEDVPWDASTSPAIMRPNLHQWTDTIDLYLPLFTELETELKTKSAIQCLLTGGCLEDSEGDLRSYMEQILCLLAWNMHSHSRTLMLAIISHLSKDGSNVTQVYCAISPLSATTKEGTDACLHILTLHQEKSLEVAEVVLAGWLQAPSLSVTDSLALKSIAEMLRIDLEAPRDWSEAGLKFVVDYLDEQYAAIFAEAQRLDNMRASLKAVDPSGTSLLLTGIGIEDPSPADDALSKLPAELINVIEKVDDQRVEMLFPLVHLTPLQRVAMGVGDAQSLTLRFALGDGGMPPAFCMHLDTESKGRVDRKTPHIPHEVFPDFPQASNPDLPICSGRTNPAKYHLARLLSRHLVDGYESLEVIHALITDSLKTLGQTCIVCGRDHGTKIRRSIVCSSPTCYAVILKSSLEVRLSKLREDPAAVDLLLTMIHAAATSGKMELIPGCPFESTAKVLTLINKLPAISSFQKVDDLAQSVRTLGRDTEKLLSWVCTSYRGFLASANGALRIPSLPPGTHQFVLANGTPEHELAFSTHVSSNPTTRVLFHGTSFDRMFAITCQGLRVLSNTPLQANGAYGGVGIYLAEEPSMSWAYTNRGPHTSWAGSQFKNFKVLLGCENAGPAVGTGMHVVKDQTTVVVRYVFLIPSAVATVPIRAHLEPAMASAFSSLRSGAL